MNKEEIQIANKDVYLKIDPYESIELKRLLLEVEASSVNMQLIAERLKEKTRLELRERSIAKKSMRDASNMIFDLIQRLPKTKEFPTIVKRQISEESEEKKVKSEQPRREAGYTRQLEDLRKRIAGLG